MKSNIFGYLFFAFIIGITIFAVYKVNSGEEENTENSSEGAMAVSSIEKGTTMTLGISDFDTINPIITTNKKVQDITKIMYDSLVTISEDGKVESCLAKEWKTADNKTYIIKLRSDVKWSDGSSFSSSDVNYTIDRLKDEKSSKAVYSENVKYVEEVDIVDNTTLRIILSKQVPFYEYYLNFPILSSNYYGDDDFWNTSKNEKPITTGRFKITEVSANTITLEKNNSWWNIGKEDSVIEKITINLYSSVAELYNAFKLGSIDLIATENSNYKEYIGTIGYNTKEIEGRDFTFLALNTQSTFLSDVNVRKAVRDAIDKDDIVSNVYNKTYTKANFPLNTSSYLVEDSNENPFNIDEFERLLRESGWTMRNKHWQKVIDYKTTNLELTLVVKSNTTRANLADYLKTKLAERGITINVIKASNGDYQKYLQNKNYDMILCESTIPIAPDLTTYFGDGNLANYSNDEVKEIMSYIDNITDEEELKSKYKKLYELYNNDVPYIGIARSKIYVITNTYLSGDIDSRWYYLFFNFKEWYTS